MTDRHGAIKASYRQLGGSFAGFYDGMITYTKPIGKLFNRAVWGFDAETTKEWINGALAGVPEGFAGRLLEVPVGTGVLTMPLYRDLPGADVTCLDYSPDMMRHAEKRAEALGLKNVAFRQGDVGALPFPDESFDIVLSLNGFHAFPDKEAAYRETFRVLKPGGTFCGCFYTEGGMAKTDRFVRRVFVPKHSFTPPFETRDSLEKRLGGMYREAEVRAIHAEAIFRCVK